MRNLNLRSLSAELSTNGKFSSLRSLFPLKNLGTRKLFSVTLIIQIVAFLGILFDIPILRQVIGFFYLSFLPGFLFLKIIRLEKSSLLECILFSGGISVALLMLFGLVLSLLYPALNILRPLSGLPLIASMIVLTLALYVTSWIRTRRSPALQIGKLPENTLRNLKFHKLVPLLVCIPILTIFGAEMLVSSGNNIVLLFLIIIVSAIMLCTFSERLVPKVAYPLIVLAISLFLLFHTTLVSNYLIGYDVHLEFYLANLTFNRGGWDITIPHEYNAMLSVTVLPVIYSNFLNLDLNWVFKAVYPLIFSFVPLSLFVTYRKLTNSRIAFLSVFFFMAIDVFYFAMLGLDRQMIGEFFFALLILLVVEDKISVPKRTLLFIIFSVGLVVSHYATTYLFIFLILFAFFLSRFVKRPGVERQKLLSGGLVLGCVALVFVWYIVVAPTPFDALANTFNNIREGLLTSMAAPGISGLAPSYSTALHSASQFLFYGLQLSIIVGLFGAIFLYKKMKFDELYLTMSTLSLLILIFCIVLPSFAAGLVVERFYHLASFFLAPFAVLGILTFCDQVLNFRGLLSTSKFRSVLNLRGYLLRILGRAKFRRSQPIDLKVKSAGLFLVSLVLVAFFLFQVGFIYEIAGGRPSSISLSYNKIQTKPTAYLDLWVATTPEKDVFSAKWLSQNMNRGSIVYADYPSKGRVLTSYALFQTVYFSEASRGGNYNYILSNNSVTPVGASYVYLRTLNVVYGIVEGSSGILNTTSLSPFLSDCDLIYANGGSQIYKNRP
jgi:uncharacterized membrane protein